MTGDRLLTEAPEACSTVSASEIELGVGKHYLASVDGRPGQTWAVTVAENDGDD